ncbi:MAG: ribonuclease HII [Candidatus Midichloriaceae bacterium]|jgi:ribonuclease HII
MSNQYPNFEYEKNLGGKIVGIDEVGRGCLAGPVVAAGIILSDEIDVSEINDSKKISEKKRIKLHKYLTANCTYSIGISSVEEIEDINILQASLLAMRRVINQLSCHNVHIIVDGNVSPDTSLANITNIVSGDQKSLTIAAASIIAKVTRDNIMKDLDLIFPQYYWKKNKGYGTIQHREAIKLYGTTKHHRDSFLSKII